MPFPPLVKGRAREGIILLLRRGWVLPLFLALFVDNVRGTPVRAAAVLAAALWAAWVLARAPRRPAFSPLMPLFLLWSAAGAARSVHLSNTLDELTLLAGACALHGAAAVLFLEFPGEKDFFARALLVLALLKGGAALLLPAAGGRALLNPGDAGTANVSLVPMFLVLSLVAGRSLSTRPWRAAWGLLLAMALWLCVRWNAMAALLGLAVGFPLEAAFRRGGRGLFWGAAAAGAAALALLFSTAAPKWVRYNPDDPNRLERLAIWSDSLTYAGQHLLGTGLGTYEQYYPQYKSLPGARTANFAHNEWIQLLCESGLPGVLLLLPLLAGLAGRLRAGGRSSPGPAAGLALLGLWACVYFVFRSDALLFTGALSAASFPRPGAVPVRPVEKALAAALAALLAVLVLPPAAAQVQERRGGDAWNRGDDARALSLFRSAARWNPLEPRFLDEQVECLRRLDRKEETLPLLEKAVSLKPRDVWLRRKLAVARLHLKDPGAARDAYAPILDLAPNVEQFRREYRELSSPPPVIARRPKADEAIPSVK